MLNFTGHALCGPVFFIMRIRPIEAADLPNVISMIREFAEFEDLAQYCEVDEKRLRAAMFGADAIVEGLVAVEGDTFAGYALFYPAFSSFRGELGLHLEDLYVKQEYRGQGIGRSLLRAIAEKARARGFVRIDLMVSEQNRSAKAFYERLGAQCNSGERHFKFSDTAFIGLTR